MAHFKPYLKYRIPYGMHNAGSYFGFHICISLNPMYPYMPYIPRIVPKRKKPLPHHPRVSHIFVGEIPGWFINPASPMSPNQGT